MTAADPQVTVCIPTLGRPSLAERAVPSVLSQTGVSVEVVVAVNTPTPIERMPPLEDPRVVVLADVRGSVGAVRNAAAASASAGLLLFLDDDDELCDGALAALVSRFADPDVWFASGPVEVAARDGGSPRVEQPSDLGPLFVHAVGSFLAGSFAVRAAVFHQVGGYDERLRFSENAELCMRLCQAVAAAGARSETIDQVTVCYQESGTSYLDQSADGAAVILDAHRPVFEAHPKLWADWEAIAGVALYRVGRRGDARRHLLRAVRLQPRELRHLARLAVSLVPPVAVRLWAPRAAAPV